MLSQRAHDRHHIHAWVAVLSIVTWAASADAQQFDARLDVLAGVDTNPQLAVSPTARRDGTPIDDGPGSSATVTGAGHVDAVWGEASWIGGGVWTDARAYHAGDGRHDSALGVFSGARLNASGRSQVSVNAWLGRYDASFGLDDALYARFTPQLRLGLSRVWSVGVEGHGGGRWYDDGMQRNWDAGGALDLTAQHEAFRLAIGVDGDWRGSNDVAARRAQVTPFASAQWRAARWVVEVAFSAFSRWFEVNAQDGVEAVADARVRHQVSDGVWLSLQLAGGVARGGTDALNYERFVALAGLTFIWPSPSRAAAVDRQRQGAATVRVDRVRFQHCASGVRAVSVIGTFNDWSVDAGRMARDARGCFVLDVQVPAGHHRYQLVIDGEAHVPEGAPGYVTDDFGSRDAVLIVPAHD